MSLAGLVQVRGAGLRGAQHVEATQGVAGQRLGALGDVTRPLLQEPSTGGERRSVLEAGATLNGRHLRPAGGDKHRTRELLDGAGWITGKMSSGPSCSKSLIYSRITRIWKSHVSLSRIKQSILLLCRFFKETLDWIIQMQI